MLFMKNKIKISMLCICILLTAVACGTGIVTEGQPSDESVEATDVIENDREELTEAEDDYEETMAAPEESIVENDSQEAEEESGEETVNLPVSESDMDIENEESSDDNPESAAPTESEPAAPTIPHDCYEELITAAKECVEGKVEEEPEEYYDFSYMIYWYGAYYGASMGLGYLIEDIDGNGTDELIFGENDDDPDSAWDGVFYDLYTISDGELVHVLSGGERSTYRFCENGMIVNEGADGAAMSVYAYYSFEGTELHLVEAVIYNGWEDADNPWFYSTQTDSYYDMENLEPVSEEQARTIMEKYVYERPTFIPFVEE